MSVSFRPVRTIWGDASSEFVEHDELLSILKCIAKHLKLHYFEKQLFEMDEFWVEDGSRFLDFVMSPRCNAELFAHLGISSSKALNDVLQNIKVYADKWRTQLDDGALRLWID